MRYVTSKLQITIVTKLAKKTYKKNPENSQLWGSSRAQKVDLQSLPKTNNMKKNLDSIKPTKGDVVVTAPKMKFSIKDFFSKCDQIRSLVIFTEETFNGKLHSLCSVFLIHFTPLFFCTRWGNQQSSSEMNFTKPLLLSLRQILRSSLRIPLL